MTAGGIDPVEFASIASRSLPPAGKYVRIPVRANNDGLKFARVDPIDAYLRDYSWSMTHPERPQSYVRRSTSVWLEGLRKKSKSVYLHREIAGLGEGDPREVHHANHDVLDNRRFNLWIVSKELNGRSKRDSTESLLEIWRNEHPELTAKGDLIPVGDHRTALGHLLILHYERNLDVELQPIIQRFLKVKE